MRYNFDYNLKPSTPFALLKGNSLQNKQVELMKKDVLDLFRYLFTALNILRPWSRSALQPLLLFSKVTPSKINKVNS